MERFLAKSFKKGDRNAFKELYEIHYDKAIRLAIGIMKNEQSAKDAVQISFIRAYEYRRSYDDRKPFAYWYNRILINECKRLLTKNKSYESTQEVEYDYSGHSALDEYKFEKYELLYDALNQLNENLRIPLLLKYINGFKEAEIADILALKNSTVKSRLYEGRKRIRTIMLESGYKEYRYE